MNKEELLTLAQHIQIKLTNEEVERLLPQINNAIDYTNIINHYCETDGVTTPTSLHEATPSTEEFILNHPDFALQSHPSTEGELYFMSDDVNRLRADEPKESFPLKEVLKNAPLKNDNFFKVPKVIE